MAYKYYRAKVKCGHVGRGKYIVRDIYIFVKPGEDPAQVAKEFPRVKTSLKDAVIEMEQISQSDFRRGRIQMAHDPYLSSNAKNRNIGTGGLYEEIIKISDSFDRNKNPKIPERDERKKLKAFKRQKMALATDAGRHIVGGAKYRIPAREI